MALGACSFVDLWTGIVTGATHDSTSPTSTSFSSCPKLPDAREHVCAGWDFCMKFNRLQQCWRTHLAHGIMHTPNGYIQKDIHNEWNVAMSLKRNVAGREDIDIDELMDRMRNCSEAEKLPADFQVLLIHDPPPVVQALQRTYCKHLGQWLAEIWVRKEAELAPSFTIGEFDSSYFCARAPFGKREDYLSIGSLIKDVEAVLRGIDGAWQAVLHGRSVPTGSAI